MFKWLIDLFTEPLARHSSPFVIDNTLSYPRADEAIDLHFAGLSFDQALAIMAHVAASGQVESANIDGPDVSWEVLRARLQAKGFGGELAWVRCLDIPIGNVVISGLLMIAGEENEAYFVELSFNASRFDEQRWGSLVETLHAYAIDIQRRFGVPEIYAGIPAEDPEYRLFTGSSFGPVRFDENGVRWPERQSPR